MRKAVVLSQVKIAVKNKKKQTAMQAFVWFGRVLCKGFAISCNC